MSVGPRSPLPLVGLGLGLVILTALIWRSAFLIDDAYISFRYARNWAEHGQLAYHLNASPPVEGYSNFLWVVLLRYAYDAGLGMELASQALGIAFGVGTLVLLHLHLSRTLALPSHAVLLGDVALAAFPPFAVWCTGGLETSLFTFCVLATYAALTRLRGTEWRSGVPAGLAALAVGLTRVEGFAWVLALFAVTWIVIGSEARLERRARFAVALSVFLVGFGAFLLWRHAVYGEWVANTVHAKAGLTGERLARGWKTTASFLLLHPIGLLGVVALGLGVRGEKRAAALGLGGLFGGFVAYNWLVGGDWMPFFRFLAPAGPFLAGLIAVGFARCKPALGLGLGGVFALVSGLPVYDVSLAPRSLRESLDYRGFTRVGYQSEWERWEQSVSNLEELFLPLGRALGQVVTPEDSLTFGAIGAVGWESNMHLHDYNGLVDREVAQRGGTTAGRSAGHDKAVPRAWFLHRKPTLFHAVVVKTNTTEDSPAIRQQVRQVGEGLIEQRVFSNPAEEPLRAVTQVVIHALEVDEGLPPGSWLVVLRAR